MYSNQIRTLLRQIRLSYTKANSPEHKRNQRHCMPKKLQQQRMRQTGKINNVYSPTRIFAENGSTVHYQSVDIGVLNMAASKQIIITNIAHFLVWKLSISNSCSYARIPHHNTQLQPSTLRKSTQRHYQNSFR